MKKIALGLFAILTLGFLILQLFQPDFTNPPIADGETLEASLNVPENVSAILKRSCDDCHSNKTVYPWYSRIAPGSWFMKKHIDEGREEMNFSVWSRLEEKKRRRGPDKMCKEVKEGEMPLFSYTIIHRDAVLSEEDKKILCDWAASVKEQVAN